MSKLDVQEIREGLTLVEPRNRKELIQALLPTGINEDLLDHMRDSGLGRTIDRMMDNGVAAASVLIPSRALNEEAHLYLHEFAYGFGESFLRWPKYVWDDPATQGKHIFPGNYERRLKELVNHPQRDQLLSAYLTGWAAGTVVRFPGLAIDALVKVAKLNDKPVRALLEAHQGWLDQTRQNWAAEIGPELRAQGYKATYSDNYLHVFDAKLKAAGYHLRG